MSDKERLAREAAIACYRALEDYHAERTLAGIREKDSPSEHATDYLSLFLGMTRDDILAGDPALFERVREADVARREV